MFDFLDRLRQKPPEVRFLITLITAGVLTGLVAIVWAVSFAATLSHSNVAAPIESDSLDGLRKQFQESVEGGQEIVKSLSELKMASTTATGTALNSTATTSAASRPIKTPTSSPAMVATSTTSGSEKQEKRTDGDMEVISI